MLDLFLEQKIYQLKLIGEIILELLLLPELKIKDNVDHVGHSQLLELLKD